MAEGRNGEGTPAGGGALLRIPAGLYGRAAALAEAEGMSPDAWCERAIRLHAGEAERMLEIERALQEAPDAPLPERPRGWIRRRICLLPASGAFRRLSRKEARRPS